MIYIYTGSVGSGKSYHALVEGLRKISAIPDRYVVANFPIRFSKGKKGDRERKRWIYLSDEEITVDRLIRLSFEKGFFQKESHALLIIDEAGIFFNARDWMVKGAERAEWIKFFSQSRKFGYDVILIAQDLRMIDRQIRSMADFEVKHFLMNKYKWFMFLPCKVFAAVTKWQGTGFKGSVQFILFRKRVARRYDTMRLFKVDDGLKALIQQYGKAEGI